MRRHDDVYFSRSLGNSPPRLGSTTLTSVGLHSFSSWSGIECPKSTSQAHSKTILSQIWYHILSLFQTVIFRASCDPCFSFLVDLWSVNIAEEFLFWNIYKFSSLLSGKLCISRVSPRLWLVSHLFFCTLTSLLNPCVHRVTTLLRTPG